jgi:surface carbohydrate biosynthesis protein
MDFFFKKPSKARIVILDKYYSFGYKKFFYKKDINFVSTRYEEINIPILFFAIIKWVKDKNKLTFYQNYLISYIKYIQPKFIIFFLDHDIFFCNLKKFFPKQIIILFQHALFSNDSYNKIVEKIKKKNIINKFKIDYACIYGTHTKNFYSKYLKTKYIVTGSLKNNYHIVRNFQKLDSKSLVFISQFRIQKHKHFMNKKKFKKNFYYNETLYQIDILKKIAAYCKLKSIKLKILSSSIENNAFEKEYYNYIFGKKNFSFLKRKYLLDSNKSALKYKHFFTFSSTLGYELMSIKKNRVIFFSYKKNLNKPKNNIVESFFTNRNEGPFWTSKTSKEKIYKMLNFLFDSSSNLWQEIKNKYTNKYVIYKKNNYVLNNFFKKINL